MKRLLTAICSVLVLSLAAWAEEPAPQPKSDPLQMGLETHNELLKYAAAINSKRGEIADLKDRIAELDQDILTLSRQMQQWAAANSPCEGGQPNWMTGKWMCPPKQNASPERAGGAPTEQ